MLGVVQRTLIYARRQSAQWLNQNDIFKVMTLLEYWNGLVTTVHLVFLSLVDRPVNLH